MPIDVLAKHDAADGESRTVTPADALPVINYLNPSRDDADPFQFTGGDDPEAAAMIIDMTDVLISSYQTGGSGSDSVPPERAILAIGVDEAATGLPTGKREFTSHEDGASRDDGQIYFGMEFTDDGFAF